MSGSGSTVFGIYEDYKNAEVVQEKYSQLKNKLVYSKGYLENLV
jgi:4-diphosphocytidyl-2C-methyl-D-erythritol kinase